MDIEKINYKTSLRKEQLKNFQNCINDPDKADRLNEQLCVVCYYLPRISGRAFTNAKCQACGAEMVFATTDVDSCCNKCSETDNTCKKCLADINLRKRPILRNER